MRSNWLLALKIRTHQRVYLNQKVEKIINMNYCELYCFQFFRLSDVFFELEN